MNALIRIVIAVAIFFAFLGILSSLALFSFTADITSTAVWLLSALIPFRGVINLPALGTFLVELMIWLLAVWSFELASKMLQFFHGESINVHHAVNKQDGSITTTRETAKFN